MNLRLPGVLLTAAVLSAFPAHAAAPPADLAAYADRALAAAFPAGEPGATAIVVKDGKVMLRKGYGMANLELARAMSPEMVFELGSITKQFTAASILLLQERGKLRMEDDITKYLADYPTHGATITIENLLTHTSGIPSYTGLPEWFPRMREDLKPADLIALFKDKPLEFKPGERWAYDNSGYFLLGAIIEKVSGETYERFVEEEIFKKLGMAHSRYDHPEEVVPLRASGYSKDDGGFHNASFISMTQPFAAGSLMSTVDDLAIWDRALAGEALLRKASLDRMFTAYTLKSGASTHYGYGMEVYDFAGRRILQHGGGINGFRTNLIRVPEERLFVAVLSNNEASKVSPDDVSLRIVAKALGHALEDVKTIPLDPKAAADYPGVYRFDEETTRVVTNEGGKLFSQRRGGEKQELSATAPDDFLYPDRTTRLHFQRDAQGKVTGADFHPLGGSDQTGTKTTDPLPQERQEVRMDPAVYDALVGDYELTPTFSIAVTREGSGIFAQATGQPKFEIFPESESRYFLKVVDAEIEFVRGTDGKVTGLILHQGGRDLPGKRK
ncbi:MAG TPA: serine hydrolase [Thermoanaerobaculia bacterium]|jgi:CubicO group peptidase (beta-lactamase class C family)